MAQISGKESVLIVKVEDHKHFSLGSPTQQLIDKVHADKRMRLFEYQISYTEL